MGNASAGGFGSVSTVEVLVDGQSLGLARNDQFIPGQQGWGLFKMQVTATGSTMTLAFVNRDPSNDNSNGLDAVSLVPAAGASASAAAAPAPVAEPAPAAATAATTQGGSSGVYAVETSAAFLAAGFKQHDNQWRSACDDPGTASYSPGSVDNVADLNGDDRPEVVIIEGSAYCYGNTGQKYWLLSQQADARWKLMSSDTGMLGVLGTKGRDGWPDLSVGGPGFFFPVLRWNGRDYAQQRWEYEGQACTPPH